MDFTPRGTFVFIKRGKVWPSHRSGTLVSESMRQEASGTGGAIFEHVLLPLEISGSTFDCLAKRSSIVSMEVRSAGQN